MRIKKLFRDDFFRDTTTLVSGAVIGQVLGFVFIPILSRLYSQEIFGVYFIFVSTVNILGKFSTLRFELAVVLSKNDKIAINALMLSFCILVFTSIFLTIIFIVILHFIGKYRGLGLFDFFIFLPVVIFFGGLYEIISAWNNRQKTYKKTSVAKVTNSLAIGAFQTIFRYIKLEKIGLIMGYTAGKLVSGVVILYLSFREIMSNIIYVRFSLMKEIFFKYKKIPVFNTLINMLNNLSTELPVYVLGIFFGTSTAAFYGMSNKIVASPLDILGRSVSQVFYKRASDVYSKNNNLEIFVKTMYRKLVFVAGVFFILVIMLLPFLKYILGNKWTGIYLYVLILLPAVVANFVVQSISSLYTILSKQDKMLYLTIIFIILKFLALYLGFVYFHNVYYSLAFFSLTIVVYKLCVGFWYLRIIKQHRIKLA
jgi:O-antigen/teichoic acid export membrane protein